MLFKKEKMLKRLEKERLLDKVTPEIKEIMDALDGQPVSTQCWRRQVYDEPVYFCESKDGKIREYVNELDCE